MNRYTAFPRILRTEATGEPEAAGESLSDRMKGMEFTFTPPGSAPQPDEPAVEPKPVVADAPVDPPASPAKPADEPEKPDPADDADDDDDDLPSIGAQKKTEEANPDLDFDAQTEAIVKAIEAKGHPGDEYKRLRAEVKALKAQKPVADLDSIPEVKELKTKAAEADRFKAEADALRERQRELLRVNDEVAVKESDEFISQVRKPIAEMEKVVGLIAESAEIDAETLFSIITEQNITKQDKMLEALHQKVGTRTAGRIERFCDDYKAIESKGAAMLADAGKNAERSRLAREQSIRDEAQKKVELFKASVETSFTNYAKRIPGFTDSSGNLTDVAHATMAKTAEVDLNALGPDDLGYMAFAANALPEARKAIVRLQKEVALLKGSKPEAKPMDGKTSPPPEKDDEYQGLSERMKGMEFTFTPPS